MQPKNREKKTVTFTVAPAPSSSAQEVGNEAKMSRTTSGTNCFRTAATAEQLHRDSKQLVTPSCWYQEKWTIRKMEILIKLVFVLFVAKETILDPQRSTYS